MSESSEVTEFPATEKLKRRQRSGDSNIVRQEAAQSGGIAGR